MVVTKVSLAVLIMRIKRKEDCESWEHNVLFRNLPNHIF